MSGLFSRPKTPIPEIAAPTPIADEEVLKRSKKKKIAAKRMRTGRQATILSDKEALG